MDINTCTLMREKEKWRGRRRIPLVRAGGLSRTASTTGRGRLFPFQALPVTNYRGNLQSVSLQMCESANPHEPSFSILLCEVTPQKAKRGKKNNKPHPLGWKKKAEKGS